MFLVTQEIKTNSIKSEPDFLGWIYQGHGIKLNRKHRT